MTSAVISFEGPTVQEEVTMEDHAGGGMDDGGLHEAILCSDAALVSFDVFDTVLTRRVGDPSALFYQIGAEIASRNLVACSPLMFVQVRYANEQRARTNRDGREVTLREIYEEVSQVLHCEDLIEELMKIEIEAEARSLRPIPQAVRAVAAARGKFGKVVFISDMYLPYDFIKSELVAKGFFKKGDALYLSSEVGVQKGDGRLFQHLLQAENIHAASLLHCGDSMCYDIEPARKLGIRTFHCGLAIPHPAERALNMRSSWNAGFGAGLAGAARLARLGCPETEPVNRTMWETGATVTGPFVLLYAQWILDRAVKLGITQLCFLARDGYLPYLAVKELLAGGRHPEISVLYIHGSRPTYLALGVGSFGAEEWDDLTTHGGRPCLTVNDLSMALMLSEETIARFLDPLGFGGEDRSRKLQLREIDAIRRAALENQDFNAAIVNDLLSFQDRVRRYFEGIGFNAGESTALVDSGWTTRSHAPLFAFLENLGCRNLKLFYIGVMVDETHVPLEKVEAFVFDMARKRGPISRKIYYARPCEALLFADHGRTVDFAESGGRVVPVLAKPENPSVIERCFESYLGGVKSFLAEAMDGVEGRPPPFGVANLAEQVISRFWCDPTRREAEAWSQMEWQWDPQGRVTYPFSRKYQLGDVWQAIRQERCPHCYPQFWVAGSAVLSERWILFVLKAAGRMSRIAHDTLRGLPKPLRNALKWTMKAAGRGKDSSTLSASAMMAMEIAPYLSK